VCKIYFTESRYQKIDFSNQEDLLPYLQHCHCACRPVHRNITANWPWHLCQFTSCHLILMGFFSCYCCYCELCTLLNKAIVDYTSPALCTPVTPFRRQAMRPIVSMLEEDRATDIGNMHKKLERSRLWFRRYPRGQTDTQTDILITIQ